MLMGMSGPDNASWVESVGTVRGFGLAHLPYGVMLVDGVPSVCVAVGGEAVDLRALSREFPAPLRQALESESLNALMQLGAVAWKSLRGALTAMLRVSASAEMQKKVRAAIVPRLDAELTYPLETRGFVDFYASIDHARRVGELFRPQNPLLPNYEHVPIAYNGRASSLVVGGTVVRRPWGQRRSAEAAGLAPPVFAPSAALDYEAELGLVVAHGNLMGEPIAVRHAGGHLFGVALLNDWSARDVQSWEAQPLGPFLGKSFATSLSPWITPMAALEPFRVAARVKDAAPLPYLLAEEDQERGGLDARVEVWLSTTKSRADGTGAMLVSQGLMSGMFWTPAQMLAHAASNGCPVETGDVLGTGTISGESLESAGCLLERTRNGAEPLRLANGEERRWLEDGDEVVLRGWCEREGVDPVCLGECVGRVMAAHRSVLSR
jgi:fumarylacetoacetase